MKQAVRKFITLAPIALLLLSVVQLVVSNLYVRSGKEMRSADISIDQMRSENAVLEQQVASASSLLTISVKAKDRGFVEPRTSQYLTIAPSKLPVAFNLAK